MHKLHSTLVALVLTSSSAFAHHGSPGYDFSKPLNLEGTVVKVQWGNPHLYFTIENMGEDNKVRQFDIEAASLSTVLAFGLQKEMISVGTQVKVLGFGRLRNPEGSNYKGATITLPDGSVYYLENTPSPQPVKEGIAAQALGG